MVSHTEFGGIRLTLGKGGLRFRKKASAFNRCVGSKLRGQKYTGADAAMKIQSSFTQAVKSCSK